MPLSYLIANGIGVGLTVGGAAFRRPDEPVRSVRCC